MEGTVQKNLRKVFYLPRREKDIVELPKKGKKENLKCKECDKGYKRQSEQLR